MKKAPVGVWRRAGPRSRVETLLREAGKQGRMMGPQPGDTRARAAQPHPKQGQPLCGAASPGTVATGWKALTTRRLSTGETTNPDQVSVAGGYRSPVPWPKRAGKPPSRPIPHDGQHARQTLDDRHRKRIHRRRQKRPAAFRARPRRRFAATLSAGSPVRRLR